jgi:oxygen-dependent protoporphyrinogen oxidase
VRIAIIGGGISGLTAAHLLAGGGHDVVLIDEAPEPGGLVSSPRVEGFLCERGPQAVLDGSDETRALIASAGLEPRIVRALPASRRRSVYLAGRLRPFPAGPPALLKTDLFSAGGKLRLLGEPFVRRRAEGAEDDESVFDFVARRFGRQAAQRAAGPALIGIYAGDATALSLRAAFPRLAALEREHGSVLRGLFRTRGRSRLGRPVSFPDGLSELPRALAATLGSRRRVATAGAIEPAAGGGWTVALEGGGAPIEAERLVLATPAAASAALLAPHAPAAAEALGAIPHAPVAVVCLGFRAADAATLGMNLDSYGFVVARGEGLRLLGCQFESSVFPGRAPDGGVLLRALLGGTFDPALVEADDQVVAGQAIGDLRRAVGLRREPDLVRVWRARPGIPQYDRGHLARIRAVDDAVARLPGLTVIGQALRGVGMSACIQTAAALSRDFAT